MGKSKKSTSSPKRKANLLDRLPSPEKLSQACINIVGRSPNATEHLREEYNQIKNELFEMAKKSKNAYTGLAALKLMDAVDSALKWQRTQTGTHDPKGRTELHILIAEYGRLRTSAYLFSNRIERD